MGEVRSPDHDQWPEAASSKPSHLGRKLQAPSFRPQAPQYGQIYLIEEIMKDIKQLEKEIIKSLEVNINVNWDAGENNPSEEFEMLIDHVKRLFKKYA